MAHATSRRGGATSDKTSGWLPAAFFLFVGQKRSGFFFCRATNFPNHDD
jgi:hypothetical protein